MYSSIVCELMMIRHIKISALRTVYCMYSIILKVGIKSARDVKSVACILHGM